eukprot:scaffold70909_cov32-Tisochrysis_lutea.AAC.1
MAWRCLLMSLAAVAVAGLGPRAQLPSAARSSALRSAVFHCRLCAGDAAAADGAKPLKSYVEEIRKGKSALRRGLKAEGGVLSEDALALALGLSKLNPTSPDPASDADLWEGKEFRLLSSALPLLGAPPPLRQGETKLALESGAASLEMVVFEGAVGVADLLGNAARPIGDDLLCTPRLCSTRVADGRDSDFAAARADLRLQITFEKRSKDSLNVNVTKAGLSVTGRPGNAAMAAVAMASMAVQSRWEVAPDVDGVAAESERVLLRNGGDDSLAQGVLTILYLDQVSGA